MDSQKGWHPEVPRSGESEDQPPAIMIAGNRPPCTVPRRVLGQPAARGGLKTTYRKGRRSARRRLVVLLAAAFVSAFGAACGGGEEKAAPGEEPSKEQQERQQVQQQGPLEMTQEEQTDRTVGEQVQ